MFDNIKKKIDDSIITNWKNKAQFLSGNKLIEFYINSNQNILDNQEIIYFIFDRLNENDYKKLPINVQEKYFLMVNDKKDDRILIYLNEKLKIKYINSIKDQTKIDIYLEWLKENKFKDLFDKEENEIKNTVLNKLMEYLNKENKIEQWLSDAENISTIESMNVEFKKNFFQSINFSQQLNISLDKIKDINLLISAVESNYKINYNQFLEIANKGLMIKEVSNKYISDTLKYIGDNFTSEQVKELINIFATKENNGRIVINDNKIMFDSTIMKFMFDYIEKNYQNEEKEKAITKLYQNTNLNEHLFNAPMEFRTTLFLNGNNIDYSLLNTDSILKRFKNIYGEEKYNEYKETLKFVADNYYNSKLQNNISQLNKLMDYSLKRYN